MASKVSTVCHQGYLRPSKCGEQSLVRHILGKLIAHQQQRPIERLPKCGDHSITRIRFVGFASCHSPPAPISVRYAPENPTEPRPKFGITSERKPGVCTIGYSSSVDE